MHLFIRKDSIDKSLFSEVSSSSFLRQMDILENPMRFLTLDLKAKLITSESVCLGEAYMG